MHRTNLGELEELVLLMVGVLHDEGYGVSIKAEIEKQTGRIINISALHSSLKRLEDKGYVRSRLGGATATRGGRRKRFFELTISGKAALDQIHLVRSQLWQQIPKIKFN